MSLTSNQLRSTQISDLVVAPIGTTGAGSASLGNTNIRNTLTLGTETSQVVNGVTTYTDAGGNIQVLLNGVLYTLTPTQVRYLTSISKDLATALSDCNAYTDQKIEQLVGLAPTTLDTLAEIASAIMTNQSTVATMNSALALKSNLAGPQTFTGAHTFADLTVSTINTVTATELSFIKGVTSSIQNQLTSTLAVANNKLNTGSPQVVGWLAFGNTSSSLSSAVATQGGIGWNYSGGLGEVSLLCPSTSQNSLIPAFRFYKTLAGNTTTSTLFTIFNDGAISTTGAANVGALTCSSLNTIPSATLAFLSGTTSNIQTQIGSRLPVTNPVISSGWLQLANLAGALPTGTSAGYLGWNATNGQGEMTLMNGTAIQTGSSSAFDFRKMLTATTTSLLFRVRNDGSATLLGSLTAAGGVFTNPPTCSTNAANSTELTNLATVNALLANYPTSTSLTTTLASYPTSASLVTMLLDYVTNATLTTTLASYPTSTSLTSTLANYVTNSGLTSTLTSYALKTYVDSSIANLATTGSLAAYAQTAGNNSWTGSNSFSQTPTCSAAAVNATDLTTKAYVDMQVATCTTPATVDSKIAANQTTLLSQANTWTSAQTFNTPPVSATDPSSASQVANKNYTDTQVATRTTPTAVNTQIDVKLVTFQTAANTWSGVQTFSSPPISATNPSSASQVSNKSYVDTVAAPLAPRANPQFSGVSYWQNAGGVFPTTANGFGALSSNHSNGHAEFDLWNTATAVQTANLDAFRFNKCTSTTAATTLLRIRNDGSAALTGALTVGGDVVANNQRFLFGTGSVGTIFAAQGLNIGVFNISNAYFAVADFTRAFGLRIMDEGGVARVTANLQGAVTAVSGAFSGALSAASLTISGALSAASMTLSGALNAASATISGILTANQVYCDTTVRSQYFTAIQGLQLGDSGSYFLNGTNGNASFNQITPNVVMLPTSQSGVTQANDGRLGSFQSAAIPTTFRQAEPCTMTIAKRGLWLVVANVRRLTFGTNPNGLEFTLVLSTSTDPNQSFSNGFIVNGGTACDLQCHAYFYLNVASMDTFPATITLDAIGSAGVTSVANTSKMYAVRIG